MTRTTKDALEEKVKFLTNQIRGLEERLYGEIAERKKAQASVEAIGGELHGTRDDLRIAERNESDLRGQLKAYTEVLLKAGLILPPKEQVEVDQIHNPGIDLAGWAYNR